MHISRLRLSEAALRAAIYTRVSDDKQDGRSCEEQETECRKWVAYEGWDLVRVLSDPNVSASRYSKKDRPDWVRLLDLIRRGAIDAVVFWELERGIRSWKEWAEFADLAEDRALLIMVDGRVYDATDPRDMAHLAGIVTRGIEEVGKTRRRVTRATRSQAEKGGPSGTPVFGTRSVYDPDKGTLLRRVVDRTPWPTAEGETTPVEMMRYAAERVRRGHTPHSVVAEWNRLEIPSPKGGKWSTEALTSMLKRPALMGMREWHGRLIKDTEWGDRWEKVLSPQVWYEVQEKLKVDPQRSADRRRMAGVKHEVSGIGRCGRCGAPIGVGVGGRAGTLVYRCEGLYEGAKSGCVTRSVTGLHECIEALIVAEFCRPDVAFRFLEPKADETQVAEDERHLEYLKSELQLVKDGSLKTGRARIPMVRVLELEASLGAEISEVEERLRKRTAPLPQPVQDFLAAQGAAGALLKLWRSWSVEQKRSALLDFTQSIHILPTGRVGRRKLLPSESVDIRFVGDPEFVLLGPAG
ncbi:recombinase family protein [Nocardiopsis synnemataformans]|uniref:recombinase family protein n=1 Tax=Nocardiopsis synnemataformans TaxID=61305 RepID=UPI003EBC1EB5